MSLMEFFTRRMEATTVPRLSPGDQLEEIEAVFREADAAYKSAHEMVVRAQETLKKMEAARELARSKFHVVLQERASVRKAMGL